MHFHNINHPTSIFVLRVYLGKGTLTIKLPMVGGSPNVTKENQSWPGNIEFRVLFPFIENMTVSEVGELRKGKPRFVPTSHDQFMIGNHVKWLEINAYTGKSLPYSFPSLHKSLLLVSQQCNPRDFRGYILSSLISVCRSTSTSALQHQPLYFTSLKFSQNGSIPKPRYHGPPKHRFPGSGSQSHARRKQILHPHSLLPLPPRLHLHHNPKFLLTTCPMLQGPERVIY